MKTVLLFCMAVIVVAGGFLIEVYPDHTTDESCEMINNINMCVEDQ